MNALQILQEKFGYSSFRLEQEAIIHSVLQKQDTFALMPTGGGKSLCYQVPALLFDGLTIVISPLIALMKDQVDALRVNGIAAAFLNSTQTATEQHNILNQVTNNTLKLLYLAPESGFLNKLSSFNVSLIAIDEAHCISQWGHDFRPEYLLLAKLKHTMPQVPVIALTATADRLTRKDILEKLELHNPVTFISSFNRANIRYTVEPKKQSFDRLLDFLTNRKDESGIVYCLSRASVETLAHDLTRAGFNALPYHAGLPKEERANHQEMFLRDETKIMVATVAFGMGIDKSNVRYVVHMDLPKNIESYYQETGRAGRDGLASEALLFYSYADVSKMKRFVEIEGNTHQSEIQLKKLDQMAAYGDLVTCRRKYLLTYFDEQTSVHCGNCDICLTKVDRVEGTEAAQKVLSAVTRLQERFGAGYIIDFLRGSNAEKIQAHHKQLKTYGIGADMSKETGGNIIRDLLAQEYLMKADGLYPVLKLTPKSTAVLRGEEVVMITKSKEKIEARNSYETPPYEAELFRQLKALRMDLAKAENVPAYIVQSDATLVELAAYLPHTREELANISGFGHVKIEKYGQQFLNIVIEYCRAYNLTSRTHLKQPKRPRNTKPNRESDTKKQSLDLFKAGNSIATIAELRKLSVSSIENHLTFYIEQGQLSIHDLVEDPKIIAIQQAIDHVGGGMLSPIKQHLGDGYSYGEIHMVLAYRRSLQS